MEFTTQNVARNVESKDCLWGSDGKEDCWEVNQRPFVLYFGAELVCTFSMRRDCIKLSLGKKKIQDCKASNWLPLARYAVNMVKTEKGE